MVMGLRGVVASGHYLATQAGMRMFHLGGNAFDAAAAAGFALTVLQPHQNGLAGEVPMVIYSAEHGRCWAVSGQGPAPAAARPELFARLGLETIPGDGLLPAVVPGLVDAWILVLRRFGTLRLAQVLAPAIELAERGFAMYDVLGDTLASCAPRFRRDWPSSAEAYLPGGKVPRVGQIWRQPALAGTLRRMAKADGARRRRDHGLRAGRDVFYTGPVAGRIARFCRHEVPDGTGSAHAGLLTAEDLAGYEGRLESPVSATFHRWRVAKCGPWSQGPVLLETLKLLEGFDLAKMGHNSAEYIHTVVEAMKLAFADRQAWYGDPEFSRVPLRKLLSDPVVRARRRLIDRRKASLELRPWSGSAGRAVRTPNRRGKDASPWDRGDTTAVQAADAAGNLISAIQSGGWLMHSPVIPSLGFPLGTRGQIFSLDPDHPNCIAPGKRPRTTLTPSLAGAIRRPPELAFGSPGGDCQDQWALQFFLNVAVFGMNLQQAAEAPTFWSRHWPDSFHPHQAEPGALNIERRVPKSVRAQLARRGHRLKVEADWAGGNAMAAGISRPSGVLSAAVSPRYDPAQAGAW